MKSSTVGFYYYQRQSEQEQLNVGLFISQEMALFWRVCNPLGWSQNALISSWNINKLANFLPWDYLHEKSVKEQRKFWCNLGSVWNNIYLVYLASATQMYFESNPFKHPYQWSSVLPQIRSFSTAMIIFCSHLICENRVCIQKWWQFIRIGFNLVLML